MTWMVMAKREMRRSFMKYRFVCSSGMRTDKKNFQARGRKSRDARAVSLYNDAWHGVGYIMIRQTFSS